ncbi:MAG: cupin domain-containing protein [Chloroflexota bacterium]|jgi:mannose-6-phosphate isomerase-like protein (cupin superfamily)|nr:cupin domain-containing protein [Chloroflexota bacterium]
MTGYHVNIEKKTEENEFFREVLYTGPHSQLVVMSIGVGEDIGLETHDDIDQFIRIEGGTGKAVLDDEYELKDGSAVVIPAGTKHNVINTSPDKALKLYTVYTPPEHPDGVVHKTKAEAVEYEKEHHHDH